MPPVSAASLSGLYSIPSKDVDARLYTPYSFLSYGMRHTQASSALRETWSFSRQFFELTMLLMPHWGVQESSVEAERPWVDSLSELNVT